MPKAHSRHQNHWKSPLPQRRAPTRAPPFAPADPPAHTLRAGTGPLICMFRLAGTHLGGTLKCDRGHQKPTFGVQVRWRDEICKATPGEPVPKPRLRISLVPNLAGTLLRNNLPDPLRPKCRLHQPCASRFLSRRIIALQFYKPECNVLISFPSLARPQKTLIRSAQS